MKFAQFGEKFSKSRFWVILVEIMLLVLKKLVYDCKCCNPSKSEFLSVTL